MSRCRATILSLCSRALWPLPKRRPRQNRESRLSDSTFINIPVLPSDPFVVVFPCLMAITLHGCRPAEIANLTVKLNIPGRSRLLAPVTKRQKPAARRRAVSLHDRLHSGCDLRLHALDRRLLDRSIAADLHDEACRLDGCGEGFDREGAEPF